MPLRLDTDPPHPTTHIGWGVWVLAGALSCGAGPALAQVKAVGPDGKVTYTDQAPPPDAQRVQQIQLRGSTPQVALADLPISLRAPAQRYPVTLYSAKDCSPCDRGRAWLQQRGIPFVERTVNSGADQRAFAQVSSSARVPLLTVGSQALAAFNPDEWQSYLDAAGYPKTSVLPASYRAPAATPLAPTAAPAAATQAPPNAVPAAEAEQPRRDPSVPNIRF